MSSISSPDVEQANILREEGNELYKSGNLLKAIKKYQESAKLVPESYAPLGNLSAAYFEVGKYSQCITRAERALELLGESKNDGNKVLVEKFRQRINKARANSQEASQLGQLQTRLRILDSLPRYRPSLMTSEEYFTIGHDQPTSLFDLTINKHDPIGSSVSFLFGGIGDARHLLRTIIEELSGLETDSEDAENILTTLFFVFIAVIIPRIAFDHLHRTIDKALSALQSGENPLKWMYLHKEDLHFCSAVDEVTRQLHKREMELPPFARQGPVPTSCKSENKLYKATAILIPPKRVLQKYDPQMLVLLQDHIAKPKTNAAKFKRHLQEHWNFNTTLVDVEWYDSLLDKSEFDIGTDAFSALESLGPEFETLPTKAKNPERLFDYFAPFFIDFAQSIKYLKGRLQLYRDDEDSSVSSETSISTIIRRKDFPALYDRIHLSNVPDYMGGHLSTFLYASPLLKPLASSSIESNCLRNSGTWDNLESFLAEYQLITDTKMLQQLTSVTVLSRGTPPWPMASYANYGISGSLLQSFEKLLPRKAFMKWFNALFFRLAIPYNLDLYNFGSIIYSPLTLSIVFRLIVHLRMIGYPSHWLSEALFNILENKVHTTARPPRRSPNPVIEVKREHPAKHLCTNPFAPEMGTLTRIFEALLPFSLPSLPMIPQTFEINNYKFSMNNVVHDRNNSVFSTHLALVFWDHYLLLQCGDFVEDNFFANLRGLLDPSWGDEHCDAYKGTKVETLREKGLVIWTTIGYDVIESVASVLDV
ncbi:hypothetical protein EYC84_008064 [Monilinia fructicola]|uniref:Uncharacterized protein n=1 Tax=Monilinia fructicola TaxID=38448 RepID=A0A5M9JHZ4_MONFR|nr:hypothetical protein EYC84_008064 [Monilinia fructicola]